MTGILYYNFGEGALLKLAVSVFSLRNHYGGPVTVAAEGPVPGWFVRVANGIGIRVTTVPRSRGYFLLRKSRAWRHSPYDATVFLDNDTLVCGPVEEALEAVSEGLMVTNHNGWHTHRGRVRGRISSWNVVDPELVKAAIRYGTAINTGVFGWRRGVKAIEEYEALTARGWSTPGVMRRVVDEIAMQLLLPHHPHRLLGPEWNCCPVHGDWEKARIIHFYGNKHTRDNAPAKLWHEMLAELRNAYPDTP